MGILDFYKLSEYAVTISVIKGFNDKVTAGITFNVSPEHSGNVVCNSNNNPNVFNNVYPTNTYIYVESATKCYAKPNKDFQFSSWIENLGGNSTVTLNTTAFSDSPLDYLQRFLGANDTSATLQVNRFGSFTANFKHLPPPVPPEYWTSLFTVVATALVGSLLIPAGIAWFKSKSQTTRLNSYHRDIDLYGKDNIDWLNNSYNNLINTYSEGKINNEQYTNLKTEISVLYEEIYKKRIESLKDNGNEVVLTGIGNDINDAHSKGKLSEKHFANLKTKISVFYQDIYNKKIDCANGNGILLDEVKNEIRDAFAKEKINEQIIRF